MYIFDHNGESSNSTFTRYGLVDSGTQICLVRFDVAAELIALGVPFYPHERRLYALALNHSISCPGFIVLPWCHGEVASRKRDYTTRFYVLPKDKKVLFDFLLDQSWIDESAYVEHNPAVCAVRFWAKQNDTLYLGHTTDEVPIQNSS